MSIGPSIDRVLHNWQENHLAIATNTVVLSALFPQLRVAPVFQGFRKSETCRTMRTETMFARSALVTPLLCRVEEGRCSVKIG